MKVLTGSHISRVAGCFFTIKQHLRPHHSLS